MHVSFLYYVDCVFIVNIVSRVYTGWVLISFYCICWNMSIFLLI